MKPVVSSRVRSPSTAEADALRALRLVGAVAAFLTVLGIVIGAFWFFLRAPRF